MNKLFRPYVLAGIIALITLALYLPVLGHDFVLWDDDMYVLENYRIRLIDGDLFRWSFTDISTSGFWHPVLWLSHAGDFALWGLDPFGHHLTSILLHSLNTALVVLLIIALLNAAGNGKAGAGAAPATDRGTALIAAGITGLLFGIHPLHVESVAWISERKDLLYALFFLMSLLAYTGYVAALERPLGERPGIPMRAIGRYGWALAFFALSLASKSMAVTLPAVMLILDWYPLRRVRSWQSIVRLVVEKGPFLAGSLLLVILSLRGQEAVGALAPLGAVPFVTRALVSIRALMTYVAKMVVPIDLSPLYPYPTGASFASPEYLVAMIAAAGVTIACIRLAKLRPAWLALWGYYVVSLLPVIGIVPVGLHFMADRYTYLPGLGPFMAFGLGAAAVWENADAPRPGKVALKSAVGAMALGLCMLLSWTTLRQIAIWKDSVTLWSHVIEHAPADSAVAYHGRGRAWYARGQYDRAIADLDRAIDLEPGDARFYNSRGIMLKAAGELDRALADMNKAIALAPRSASFFNNRGQLLRERGQSDQALEDFDRAIGLDPGNYAAYTNRGILSAAAGIYDDAIRDFSLAIRINPYYTDALISRGLALIEAGKPDQAVADLDRAVKLAPSNATAFLNRGVAFERLDRPEQALADYTKAIALDPADHLAYLNRGGVLRRMGRHRDARADFQQACDRGSADGCVEIRRSSGH